MNSPRLFSTTDLGGFVPLACVLALAAGLWGLCWTVPAAAQTAVAPTSDTSSLSTVSLDGLSVRSVAPETSVDAARTLIEAGKHADAVPLLRDVTSARPDYLHPEHGAAAYWLGASLAATDQRGAARTAWLGGMKAVDEAGGFDLRLADAYLSSLTPQTLRSERSRAVRLYVRLLERAGPDLSEGDREVVHRLIAELEPLLDDATLRSVIRSSTEAKGRKTLREQPETWTLRADAGTVLARWWRQNDPLPATRDNERLEEHVTRLVKVRTDYACPRRASGLDDRGAIYLRFGPPYRDREIDFNDPDFIQEVYRFGVWVSDHDFPENEIWVYPSLSNVGYYIFTEDQDCYQIAQSHDLIPDHLTQSRGKTGRGQNIAYSGLMAMRYVYRELALQHSAFSSRYSDIASYADYQETQGILEEMGAGSSANTQTVGSGINQTRTVAEDPLFGIQSPATYVPQMDNRAKRVDRQTARQRERSMPRQATDLFEDINTFPVAVRTARFLTPDGQTRAEVYWGLSAESLRPADADTVTSGALLSTSLVRYDAAYEPVDERTGRHAIAAQTIRRGVSFVGPPTSVKTSDGVSHFGLQWMQYAIRDGHPDDLTSLRVGSSRGVAVTRIDSLTSLRADGPVEMSDVNVLAPPKGDVTPDVLESASQPYPFRTIRPSRPLILAFEVYHLTRGSDGRTQYTIDYEVEGRTKRGWTRLFRGQDEQRVATSTTTSGTSERTDERIVLDLQDMARRSNQDVRVTVRVTDEVAGTEVARSVDFLLEGAASDAAQKDEGDAGTTGEGASEEDE